MKTTVLKQFLVDLLTRKGLYAVEAEMVANRMMDADRLGRPAAGSLSLLEATESIDLGDIDPRALSFLKNETPATAFYDANEGMGHISATQGVELAIKKAKEAGLAAVLIKNSQPLGSPLVYAWRAALDGMVGLCVSSIPGESKTEEESPFAHQPSAYAIPGETQIVGREFAFASNHSWQQSIPAEIALPLGMLHASLTSGLAAAKTPAEKTRGPHLERYEHLILCVDPAAFAGEEALRQRVKKLLEQGARDGVELLPNDAELTDITLDLETQKKLQELGAKFKIDFPLE